MLVNRILLVNADYPHSHYDYLSLPVGLGYISEALSRNKIEHKIFDLELGGGYKKLKQLISSYNPDIIGYSLMSLRYQHNYSILSEFKRDFPDTKIVAGGPHISTFGKKALLDCPAIDIAVMMEGEETLIDICRDKPLNEIAGIIYRAQNGDIIETEPRVLIEDLDIIPFPEYKKINIDEYPKIIPIVTSRGCPYQCIFCPIGSVMGRRFRARSYSNVVDEIEFWYNKGFRDFSIVDDVFNLIEKRVYDICDEIKKRQISGIRIVCGNGIRADRVDKDLLKRMKEAGFYYLAFGVESVSNKVLGNLKKGETIEKIEQSVKEACQLGFWVELFFLIGSPGETWQDVQESVKFALRYPIFRAAFYNLIPFPNTELYRWVEKEDYFITSPPEYLNDIMQHVNKPIFVTPELNLKGRKRAFWYTANIVDKNTKTRRLKLEKWLTREKLRDYYGIEGPVANLITWLYYQKFLNKLFSPSVKKHVIALKRSISVSLQFIKYWAPNGYKVEKYWKDRLHRYGLELPGVGNIYLSHRENRDEYLKAKEVFLSLCHKENIGFKNIRMLDIGCGTGFYAGAFLENGGQEYLGIDITDILFSKLKQAFPEFQFRKLDITTQKLDGYFDLIIMIDVTQHITNNDKFSFAMQNIRSHLNENGVLIVTSWLSDNVCHSLNEVSRPMDAYKREFSDHVFSEPFLFRDKYIFSIRRNSRSEEK